MTIKINYTKKKPNKSSSNQVLFVDEKFNISNLKKYISHSEYSIISELIKGKDLQKKIIHFDINSKRKIILILFLYLIIMRLHLGQIQINQNF